MRLSDEIYMTSCSDTGQVTIGSKSLLIFSKVQPKYFKQYFKWNSTMQYPFIKIFKSHVVVAKYDETNIDLRVYKWHGEHIEYQFTEAIP